MNLKDYRWTITGVTQVSSSFAVQSIAVRNDE